MKNIKEGSIIKMPNGTMGYVSKVDLNYSSIGITHHDEVEWFTDDEIWRSHVPFQVLDEEFSKLMKKYFSIDHCDRMKILFDLGAIKNVNQEKMSHLIESVIIMDMIAHQKYDEFKKSLKHFERTMIERD